MSNYTLKQIGFAIFTVAVYTYFFHSIWVAILFAGGIGWHEYCHLLAAKRMGLDTKGFFLFPFVGGVSLVSGRYRSYAQQAFVVLAGPMGGGALALLATVGFYVSSHTMSSPMMWMAAAAYWMCVINLFTLCPLSFLDCGQLMGTITYSLNRTLGVVCLTISTLIASVVLLKLAPMLGAIVTIFGGIAVWKELQNWNAWRKGDKFLCSDDWINPSRKLNLGEMALTIGCWLLTSGILMLAMAYLNKAAPEATSFAFFARK
jgi:putative peptide zinc metalloprotease protein